jgi:predicted metalloendopeptidase
MRKRDLITLGMAVFLVACDSIRNGGSMVVFGPPAIELPVFDPAVRPQDDFYGWVNGPWMRGIVLPSELGSYSAFIRTAETVEERLLEIIVEIARAEAHPAGSDEGKIQALYRLYMDRVLIQLRGTKFLIEKADLWLIEDKSHLEAMIARRLLHGLSAPIAFRVLPDAGGSGRNVLHLLQSGLGLPDRDYYLATAPGGRAAEILETYENYVADVFRLLELDEAEKRAQGVIEIERALAAAHWPGVESRDWAKTFNPFELESLEQLTPSFEWPLFFRRLGVPEIDGAVVQQPSFVAELARLKQVFTAGQWSDYFLYHLANDLHDLLPDEVSAARFPVFGRQLRGQEIRLRPEERIVAFMNRMMGPALGRLYLERHFSEAERKAVEEIALDIRAGFRKRLEANRWMSGETQKAALRKLDRMSFRIGSAAHPIGDKSFHTIPALLVDTALGAGQARTIREFGRLGRPSLGAQEVLLPQTIGAYYQPFVNVVNIPAGILQAPFFEAGREVELNYGAIGGIIGHEIIHGFDDQGRKLDQDGRLRDWWNTNDATEFARFSERVVTQYSGLVPRSGLKVDGRRTLSENIGDLGGLMAALEGLRLYQAERGPSQIDSQRAERRFFIGWGRIWRRVDTQEEFHRRLLSDTHAMAEYRVNIVLQNLKAFHQAFGVRPGDRMWLPPEDRVNIW